MKIKAISMKKYKKIVLYVLGGLIIIFMGFYFFNKKPEAEVFTVANEDLAFSGVTIGGTVVAQNEVELSFQSSGRISQVNYEAGDQISRGDVIARLDASSISANLLKAQADLDAERARLDEIKYAETVTDSGLTTQRAQLLREMQNAYTVTEDAVMNKTDRFFDNPRTFFPKIFNLFNSASLREEINETRRDVGNLLDDWREFSSDLTVDFSDQDVMQVQDNIREVQKYLDLVAIAVNQFEPQEENSLRTQAMVDMYKTNTSTARSNLNTALSAVIEKQEPLRPTSSQVPFQEARVKSAQATVQSFQADLENTVIRAPFTGLITKQDAKVGMSAFSDQVMITMISDSNFAIEGFLPEIYISQINVGTKAQITLNPYGSSQLFNATVTYIDPAASVQSGVTSYKVNLTFDENDERIRSGMTGDIELITKDSTVYYWIPLDSVIDQSGSTYVKVQSGSATELRKIEITERTDTEAKVVSGLIVGDQIILETK